MNIIKRIPLLSAYVVILTNIILSAWSILHNDIFYYTDIGRDFLIFDEIVTKKLVIFGPRADMQGLFHGILWHYLNVPAFILGHGNPVFQGWFWIGFTIAFLVSVYYVSQRLFDKTTALISTLLLSTSVVQIAQGFFHGNGAMLIMPLFFYFFVRYFQTKNIRFLIAHLVTGGRMVHFELALGGPLAILSIIALTYFIIKYRLFFHIVSFAVLLIFASTFLLIEVKYNFLQSRSFILYLQGSRDNAAHTPFLMSLYDRIINIPTHAINIIQPPLHDVNTIFFMFLLGGIYRSVKKRDINVLVYGAFVYFYIGFYVLTLLHGGFLIMFWWLPMSVLPILVISSLHKYMAKWIFLCLVALATMIGLWQNIQHIQLIDSRRDVHTNSWQLHYHNAQKALQNAPQEYGYFIYAPDIYGYQDKYAFLYVTKELGKKGVAYMKRPVTYVFNEPPPKDFSGHDVEWWVSSKLGIKSKPTKIIRLASGYEVREYSLTSEDLSSSAEITPNDWLFYR